MRGCQLMLMSAFINQHYRVHFDIHQQFDTPLLLKRGVYGHHFGIPSKLLKIRQAHTYALHIGKHQRHVGRNNGQSFIQLSLQLWIEIFPFQFPSSICHAPVVKPSFVFQKAAHKF